MKREDIIKSDEYWATTLDARLSSLNYKGKYKKRDLIKKILDMKNELLESQQNQEGMYTKNEVIELCKKAYFDGSPILMN